MSEEQSEQPLSEAEIEAELQRFAAEQARRLGLERTQYIEPIHETFTRGQRATTTLLVCGLSAAHDAMYGAAIRGLGYTVEVMDQPDNAALQFGKEFGNRGQCNPTWFTVGNLIKHLCRLRDERGLSTAQIIDTYLFVTPSACGPCRFGMYVTEYRKALRDAGFDGFRVLLFQQQGGLKQATGEALGLEIDSNFALSLIRGILVGDVLNLMGYRMRPYEVVPGSTDAAIAQCRKLLITTLEKQHNVVAALVRCRRILGRVAVDRSRPKPLVSVIGEFWAMTTEGDGNYALQRFLESEGAEVDVQPIANWLLYMIWENRFDTLRRLDLKQHDATKYGLEGKDPQKLLLQLAVAERAVRAVFQAYAHAIGLQGHTLPDMDEIARLAAAHYDTAVRGGEGHMEVGKLIHFIEDRLNHLTISVKPFGCLPSSGVSDGVAALIQNRYPEALFLPIETTGDGKVNVYSRIQMVLFKARQKAKAEHESALARTGLDELTFQKRVAGSRRWSTPFWKPRHRFAGSATNLVYAVA